MVDRLEPRCTAFTDLEFEWCFFEEVWNDLTWSSFGGVGKPSILI